MLINRYSERANVDDLVKAIECLETVHRGLPDTFDVLRLLGAAYVLRGVFEKGAKLLSRACEKSGDPLDLLLELAQAQERYDTQAAYLSRNTPSLTYYYISFLQLFG
jgi:uncharacterized protein HemY